MEYHVSIFALPGFSALSLVDQMALLQSGWMETLVLSVVSQSLGYGEELVFAGNLRLDQAQCRAAGLSDLYTALRQLTTKYQQMNLSQEEVVTLKAMALANSGTNYMACTGYLLSVVKCCQLFIYCFI